MSKNVKVQCFFDIETYVKILDFKKKNDLKTDSTSIYAIVKRFFKENETTDIAINNLNKVIQGYEEKLRNKEHEIRILRGKNDESNN